MVDYAITPADFVPSATATLNRNPQKAGAAIVAGNVLYLDAATSTLKLAQCDGTAAEAAVVGWAANNAAIGQYVTVLVADRGGVGTAIGGSRSEGDPLFLSAEAGAMCPPADLATTNRIVFLGYFASATTAALLIDNPLQTHD